MSQLGSGLSHQILEKVVEEFWILFVGKVSETGDTQCAGKGQIVSHRGTAFRRYRAVTLGSGQAIRVFAKRIDVVIREGGPTPPSS